MIYKPYFFLTQLIVLLVYMIFKKNNWTSDKYRLFGNKYCYSIVITNSIIVGIYYNSEYQIFCNPVAWTYYILIPVAIWLIILPHIIGVSYFKLVNNILGAVSLFVLIYILLFGSSDYFLLILLSSVAILPIMFITKKIREFSKTNIFDFINYYGICILLPWICLYILVSNLFTEENRSQRKMFNLVMICLIGVSIFSTYKIHDVKSKLNDFENSKVELVNMKNNKVENYYLELVLGLHWKYHTMICLYDGWRPPLHDPFVPIARWLAFPFERDFKYIELENRKEIYANFYGEEQLELNCKCAKNERWP